MIRATETASSRPSVLASPARTRLHEPREQGGVPIGVLRVPTHPRVEADLFGGLREEPQPVVVAAELASVSQEPEEDAALLGGPAQAHARQPVLVLEGEENRVLHLIPLMPQGAQGRLDLLRFAEHGADLVEDVRAVVGEDAPSRQAGIGPPARSPVEVAGVGLRPLDLVLGEVDPAQAGQESLHRQPLR